MKTTYMSRWKPKALYAILLIIIYHNTHSQESGSLLNGTGVSVLLVDTDKPLGRISEGVYGQFLEHINHSVVDGLFAEQVQGNGFEGKDFETYWKPFGENRYSIIIGDRGNRNCNPFSGFYFPDA
jgi:hypothetical protein